MLKEKRTGKSILIEESWNDLIDNEYGVVRDDDVYGLLKTISGSLFDKEKGYELYPYESPLLVEAIIEVEDLVKEDDIGCLIISKKNRDNDVCKFEIWKNLNLAKSEEREPV